MSIRRLRALVLVAAVVVGGCGGGGRAAARDGLRAPGCTTAATPGATLGAVRAHFVALPGNPFGVASTRDGDWSFVALGSGRLAVLSDRTPTPTLVRTITLPAGALGVSLTRDGRYLLVADDAAGATVVDVAAAERGTPHSVLGTLAAGGSSIGTGAIETASSANGVFAFVTLEVGDGGIAVFNLRQALASDFRSSGYVGVVRLGLAPVGIAVAPDGAHIYATSEAGARGGQGTVSVVDVHAAETDPRHAVVATAAAGCGAVRVVVAADGSTVWVTARESDALLAFDAGTLRRDPAHALRAEVRVGEAPVGLALFDQGQRIAVADSNRFGAAGATAHISFVGAAAALAGRPAVIGSVRAGGFPREMALEPDGKVLLIGNFASGQLEAIELAHTA